jgi:DNA-binding MarR family transcriptional regulator
VAGESLGISALADRAMATDRPPRPVPLPERLASSTGYLLWRSYVYARAWAVAAMPDGVRVRHYEVLQALLDMGPCSQQQLAELLWVNRTIMVKVIDALERDGLVERRLNPADRRAYALELPAAGHVALVELSAAAERADTGLVATLTQQERSRLHALVRTIAVPEDAPELPKGLARHVGFLLGPAYFRVRQQVSERLRPLGLTTVLHGTLGTIAALGPISQRAVAEQLGLTGRAILQTVDRLEAGELVERRRDPADRRSYALELTGRGNAILEQSRAALAEVPAHFDSVLGGEPRRQELNRLLRTLLENQPVDASRAADGGV